MNDLRSRIANLSPRKREIFLQSLIREGIDVPAELLQPENSADPPLSFAQQRLWFMDQLMPGNAFYNKNIALRLDTPINVLALEKSVNAVVVRHSSLRTTFPEINGEPIQRIAAELEIELFVTDLSELTEAQREKQMQQLALENTRAPFDLSNGPLLRTSLLKLQESDYVFLLTMHHIVCDGWSLNVLFQELTYLYGAMLTGSASALPAPAKQYVDYSRWQWERLRGARLERLLGYWTEQLNELPILQLPVDRPRPPVQSYEGGVYYTQIAPALVDRLKQHSRDSGCTLFMTLLAAFKALLSYHCAQNDIVIGTYAANRDRPEFESVIGFFVNTLVLRTNLAGNPSFRELLQRVRDTALAAYAHQELPFEKLVEDLAPDRDLSRNPVFQVVFQLETLAGTEATAVPDAGSVWSTASGSAAFDLAFNLADGPQGLSLKIEFSTDLFDEDTIVRLEKQFSRVLEQVSDNPDLHLSEIAWLDEVDRQREAERFVKRGPDPMRTAVHQLFSAQAIRAPESIAVVSGKESLTYTQLDHRATTFAQYLICEGVVPGQLVGIYLDRSADMLVALLAIWKCGSAYVPLDPAYPIARIAYMVNDASLECIVSAHDSQAQLSSLQAKIVCIDRWNDAINAATHACPLPSCDDDALAYVIYTSGSTGRPKGVAVHHGAVVSLLQSMQSTPGLSEKDTLVAVTTLSFDISVLELLLPLLTGATLVIADRAIAANGDSLAQLLDDAKATVVQATPATWQLLIDSGWDGRPELTALCGGEALRRDLADELLDLVESVWNLYGPTETTIWCAVQQVSKDNLPVTIGSPINHTRLYVLDEYGRLVPPGVPGELHISGTGVAVGYLGQAELTAERFVPDPFVLDAESASSRMYKSGDLVRIRADGLIEYLGRLDSQVKLRGYRIELSEIEAVLNHHTDVGQSAVIVTEDDRGNSQLVAYVVPNNSELPDAAQLVRFLRQELPDYMVPAIYQTVDALPLTHNQKVDRKMLPKMHSKEVRAAATFVAPQTAIERELAVIWKRVLGAEKIGLDDDFFALGGHSLLATQMVSHIRSALDAELSLRQVFETPTVRGIAAVLDQQEPIPVNRQPATIKPVSREQHRLLVE